MSLEENFKLLRELLGAKRRRFVVEHGEGNRPQASRDLTEAKKKKLFECGKSDSLVIVISERLRIGKNDGQIDCTCLASMAKPYKELKC